MSAVKLGILLVRTIAKPIANSVKRRAQSNEHFERFCIGIAQVSIGFMVELQQI
jgi:hypothetical protein